MRLTAFWHQKSSNSFIRYVKCHRLVNDKFSRQFRLYVSLKYILHILKDWGIHYYYWVMMHPPANNNFIRSVYQLLIIFQCSVCTRWQQNNNCKYCQKAGHLFHEYFCALCSVKVTEPFLSLGNSKSKNLELIWFMSSAACLESMSVRLYSLLRNSVNS